MAVVGFFSHVNIELLSRAENVGCDQVLPRSAFVKRLQALLTEPLPHGTAHF